MTKVCSKLFHLMPLVLKLCNFKRLRQAQARISSTCVTTFQGIPRLFNSTSTWSAPWLAHCWDALVFSANRANFVWKSAKRSAKWLRSATISVISWISSSESVTMSTFWPVRSYFSIINDTKWMKSWWSWFLLEWRWATTHLTHCWSVFQISRNVFPLALTPKDTVCLPSSSKEYSNKAFWGFSDTFWIDFSRSRRLDIALDNSKGLAKKLCVAWVWKWIMIRSREMQTNQSFTQILSSSTWTPQPFPHPVATKWMFTCPCSTEWLWFQHWAAFPFRISGTTLKPPQQPQRPQTEPQEQQVSVHPRPLLQKAPGRTKERRCSLLTHERYPSDS